jgi:glyoxylase-like metal-dependent hydrolase (beta-lactamase superfamily II)
VLTLLPAGLCSPQDDVGEHKQWAEFFKAPRILHALEVVPDTQEVEVKLQGEGPWTLPDGGDDVTLVFTPGHTSGHVVLYYGPDKSLFTGDHLSAGYTPEEELFIYTDFNW